MLSNRMQSVATWRQKWPMGDQKWCKSNTAIVCLRFVAGELQKKKRLTFVPETNWMLHSIRAENSSQTWAVAWIAKCWSSYHPLHSDQLKSSRNVVQARRVTMRCCGENEKFMLFLDIFGGGGLARSRSEGVAADRTRNPDSKNVHGVQGCLASTINF